MMHSETILCASPCLVLRRALCFAVPCASPCLVRRSIPTVPTMDTMETDMTVRRSERIAASHAAQKPTCKKAKATKATKATKAKKPDVMAPKKTPIAPKKRLKRITLGLATADIDSVTIADMYPLIKHYAHSRDEQNTKLTILKAYVANRKDMGIIVANAKATPKLRDLYTKANMVARYLANIPCFEGQEVDTIEEHLQDIFNYPEVCAIVPPVHADMNEMFLKMNWMFM